MTTTLCEFLDAFFLFVATLVTFQFVLPFSEFGMDWRGVSRSRSRVSMDWRANSVSRSRSRAPGPIRLDFDPLDQNETHSRALLANLEEESPIPAAANAGGLPFNRGDGDRQQEHVANGLADVSTSAISLPTSNSSSSQSLLSLRLQGLHKPSEAQTDGEKHPASVSQPQLQNGMPFPPFQAPNPFQSPQYNAMFMPSSLPTFPHIADPSSERSRETAVGPDDMASPHRVLSQGQLGAGKQHRLGFDYTAVRQDESAVSDANQKPLSPVLSSSSLVSYPIPSPYCRL